MGFRVDEVFVDFVIDFSQGERGAQRINVEMAKMGKNAGVAADTQDRLERSTRRSGKAAKRTTRELTKQKQATNKLATTAKRLLVTLLGFEAIRRIFVGLTRVLTKFETRMAEVSTIAGLAAGKMKRFSREVLNLSRTVPQSADELGAGAYQIFSAGITDTADAMDVLTVASKAAVGGITSTLVSVDAITTILNAYGLEAGEATRVSDLLFQTVKGGKINFDQLSSGIGIVAKQAAVMGIGFEDVAASIAAITKATGRPRAAFTELAGLFRSIIAEEEASQKAAADLEIEWNLAAVEAIGFAGVLERLNTATEGNATKIRKVVREDEGFRAAVVLSANGARELGNQLVGMAGSAGAAETAFKTMAETTENQAKIAINNFNASLLELRDQILPAVNLGLRALTGMFLSFTGVLDRPAAVATVQTLAKNLENLTGNARLRAIAQLSRAMNDLVGGALAQPKDLLGNLPKLTDEELVAIQQALSALFKINKELFFMTEQFSDVNEEIRRRELGVKEETTGPGKPPPKVAPGLTPTQIAARLTLEKDLAERVREIALTTAEQQIEMVAELREAYVKEFGTIGAEAEAKFQLIEGAAQRALSIEKARRLGDDFRNELSRALGQIEFEAISIADEEDRARFIQERQVELLEAKVEEAKALLAVAGRTTEEEEELRKVLVETVKLQARITKEKVTQAELDEKAKREARERLRDLLTTLNLIKQSVDGALSFARAMGLVNAEMVDTIQALTQIGVGVATLIKGIGTGDPFSIISGGLGVLGGLGGLFGGKPEDPAIARREQERQDLLRENNLALALLAENFRSGLLVLEKFTGEELTRASRLIAQTLPVDIWGMRQGGISDRNLDALTATEFAFLEEIATAFGITLDRTSESFKQLQTAINGLDLTRLTESFAGAMSMLQRRFAIFDIDKPADRLAEMLQLLGNFGRLQIGLPRIDTEAGRADLQSLIESLFEQIDAGTFDIERLGKLTVEDLLNLLGSMEELLDDIAEDGVTTDDGLTENFVRSTRITEVQGNELLTLARTELVVERLQLSAQLRMVDLLGVMAAIAAPPPGASADLAQAAVPVNVGGVTVNATVVITEEVDADALVERMGGELAVVLDRELRELQTREDRAVGDTGRVA
jgi:TP901 family phage tail tape measure protein